MDGISLIPALNGKLSERPVPLAFGYKRLYKKTELYAFLNGAYKICNPDVGDAMKPYDLEKDPAETVDLSGSHPQLLQEMQSGLEEIKASLATQPGRQGL